MSSTQILWKSSVSASRAPKSPAFRLTPRDAEIIETAWRYRALTTPQIASLYFPTVDNSVSSQCLTRLRHLVAGGYLDRQEQPQVRSDGRKPYVYFLGKAGAAFLIEEIGVEPQLLDWKLTDNNVTWLYLSHLLATNDVRAAISQAVQARSWTIETWLDDRALKKAEYDYVQIPDAQGRRHQAAVVPDGYFVLSDGTYLYHHFLEVDRGTMTGKATSGESRDWARKVRIYLEYYRTGSFQKRYKTRSFRMITVTTTPARLTTLKRVTEETGGQSRFWFTTMSQVLPAKILTGPIWNVAGSDDLHSMVW